PSDGHAAWEIARPVDVTFFNNPTAQEDNGSQDCFVLGECWSPDNAYFMKGAAMGLFLQDTLSIGNSLTISAAVRWDKAYNYNPAQNRLDSPWCGQTFFDQPEQFCGGDFPEQPVAFTWSDVAPRIGVIYDITGDGTWALKGNFARYAEALGINYGGGTNVNGTGYEYWYWYDDENTTCASCIPYDGKFQIGEQSTFIDGGYPGVGTAVDPALHAPITQEFTFGIEHEMFNNILFSATGIYRGRIDDIGTANLGRPFGPMFDSERCPAECTPTLPYGVDPYVLLDGPTTIDPGDDGIFGASDDGGYVPLWARNPGRGPSNNFTTNINEFGFNDNTYYKGVSLVVSKRWADNWQILASWDIGKSEFEGSSSTASGLYNSRRQLSSNDRLHIIKVTGNYLIAEPIGVNLGMFLRAQSGQRMRTSYSYPRAMMTAPANGSPFSSGQGNQSRTISVGGDVTCPGCVRPAREPFTTLLDVRAEKQVTIGSYGVLHFYFDVFNLFNANTGISFNQTLGSRYLDLNNILPPRSMRIGGAWDF
ncbi:MAG: hypothetical protein JRF63_12945, partial [Deltaproteobacteria bacterium]|nr:hypothetical protein [Deltaproteobacteria bacterium]